LYCDELSLEAMAAYLQSNEIEIERFGTLVNVPNNDVARLMYYLQCVCTAIECDQDSDIQRYTNYNNWARLSIEEQKALLVVCYTFSPDVLDDKVFFHSDALCGNSANEFYRINQVRHQILAAESIIIAGRTRHVNQIMVYKIQWMKSYYFEPMQGLVARLSAPSRPPAITHTPTYTPTYTPSYSAPVIRQPIKQKRRCNGWCVCGCICCLVLIVIIISIVVSAVNQSKD
jgi:hypothetical protein